MDGDWRSVYILIIRVLHSCVTYTSSILQVPLLVSRELMQFKLLQNDSPITHPDTYSLLSYFTTEYIYIYIVYIFLQDENVPSASFLKLMRLNASEWPYILVGTISALINGLTSPAFSIVFSATVGVGAHCVCASQRVPFHCCHCSVTDINAWKWVPPLPQIAGV